MSEWIETEIGRLTIDAEIKKLGDCISLIIDHRGKTPKKLGSDWVENGVPAISAKHVHGGKLDNRDSLRYVTEDVYKKWMKEDVEKGDCFLVSEGATLGEILYWDNEYPIVLSQRLFCIRTNPNLLYNRYFYAYMNTSNFQKQVQGRATGSSVDGLRQTEVLQLKIPIIPIERQKLIGDLLYNLERKTKDLTEQNQTLEELAQTLFNQWFVINEKPDWQKRTLSDIVDIKIGRTPPRQEEHWFSKNSTDVKWVSIKDLGESGIYVLNTSEFLTKDAVEKFRIPIIEPNTVMLSFKMTLGRVGISTDRMVSNEAIAQFVPKEANVTPEFLYFYLKTFKYQELGSTSSIVTSINSGMIKDMPISLPDKKSLEIFSKAVVPTFKKIKSNLVEIQTLTHLRDTLLPKLMSGEITINKAS